MKEVLKKLVISAIANTFCNLLCIIIINPHFFKYFCYLNHNSGVGQNHDKYKFFLWQNAFFVEAQIGFLQKMLLPEMILCYNDTDIKELSSLFLNSSFETQEEDHG